MGRFNLIIYRNNYLSVEHKQRCLCGKLCLDKKTAMTKKNHFEKQGNARKLRIYQCDQSDWWHLSHKYIKR